MLLVAAAGCSQLDGRNRNRQGNRQFRDSHYSDAVAEYERSLAEVNDPVIHYNAGLAYQKLFRAGSQKPVLLAFENEQVCKDIPGVKPTEASVCVKENDRNYNEPCNPKGSAANGGCPALTVCTTATFCSLMSPQIADTAATHMQAWLKVQPSDDELKKEVKEVQQEIAKASERLEKLATQPDGKQEAAAIEDDIKDLEKKIDELHTKDRIRGLMTQMWIDSDQFPKAIDYWTGLLKDKPSDPDLMGVLAGINLKAGDWRKSIDWYVKVANASEDPIAKGAAYQFIGNVAWSKLNSNHTTPSMPNTDAIELADRGIAALQKASELQPESPRPVGLMASIFNFRGSLMGASWAGGLDRATAQDLQKASRVLSEKAKKAAEGSTPAPAPGGTPPSGGAATNPSPPPVKTGG